MSNNNNSAPLIPNLELDLFTKSSSNTTNNNSSSNINDIIKLEKNTPLLDFESMISNSNNNTPLFGYGDIDNATVEAFFSSSVNSTPLFEFNNSIENNNNTNNNTNNSDNWTSLFDNDIPVTTNDVNLALNLIDNQIESSSSNDNFSNNSNSYLPTPTLENVKINQKKSNLSSNKIEKIDHLGIVTYNRKQKVNPLRPVVPKSNDPVSIKRAKNTEAARRSRARKLQRMNQLEDKVEDLLNKNSSLELEILRLKTLLKENNISF